MEGENMNRPVVENRSPEQAQSRAIVIDHNLAKAILVIASVAFGSFFWLGWEVKDTIGGLDKRIGALEGSRPIREAQISDLQAADREAARRITSLEIAITGLGALRERMDQGFNEIAKRLDRMEDVP